jgi:hypothetical protein
MAGLLRLKIYTMLYTTDVQNAQAVVPGAEAPSQHLIHHEHRLDALPVPVVFQVGGVQAVFDDAGATRLASSE